MKILIFFQQSFAVTDEGELVAELVAAAGSRNAAADDEPAVAATFVQLQSGQVRRRRRMKKRKKKAPMPLPMDATLAPTNGWFMRFEYTIETKTNETGFKARISRSEFIKHMLFHLFNILHNSLAMCRAISHNVSQSSKYSIQTAIIIISLVSVPIVVHFFLY
jgi:hypothetical protein